MIIRPPAETDFEAWRALWEGYNAFYGRTGETALSDAIVRTTWGRLFDESEPVHCLVADKDGTLLGLTHYVLHRNLIQIAPTCYLQDLFTTPESRGLGVGRKLIAAVAEDAKERGANDVYWHTHRSNETARALYDKVARDTDFTVYRMPA
ncbi:MAG: GNAT family N-acetyltransferase [Alphaproteobacteria bacterium]|nr:GNAT family N-acetyltransferase [Alphaproteobacteria bacterium]